MSKEAYIENNSQYLKRNPTWHVEDSPWKAKQILKMLKRNSFKINSIAEVGCGVGEILKCLHDSMPDHIAFTGYDISVDALRQAKRRKKERLNFKLESFEETPHYYDLMLMIDVFEHIEDYMGFLKSCIGKSEYTIFHIPLDMNILGLVRNVPDKTRKSVGHLHYFTKQTAMSTLADCGYDILDYFYTPGMLELPNKSIKSKVAAIPRRMLYYVNQDFAVTLLGGYSLLVLARRKRDI